MNYEATVSGSDLLSQEEISSRRKKRLLIAAILLLIVAAVAAAAYYFATGTGEGGTATKAAAAEKEKSQAQAVTVVAPGTTTVTRMINATGTLAARREVPVGVVGEGGRVTRVMADAGDWVKQGQVLISIDRSVQSQQAAAQSAQIGVSEADLRLAQNELDRALKLVDRGFISKADVDRKTATRDSARARLNVSRAQLNATRASNARLVVRAPVGGYVLERNVEPGQTVTAGSGMLFRIAKGGEMELQAQLAESDLATVSQGITAQVVPVGTDKVFNGQIWQVSPVINAQSRQGIARIALPFDRALKPGGFASVEIKAGAIQATVLPESAVHNDNDGDYVFVVGKDNKVSHRRVKTGLVTSDGVSIVDGLSGSEKIVLFAGSFLNPGESVIPKMQKKK